MRTKILTILLAINLILALYGLGRFDGLLAPAYQRTTYLKGQSQAPAIAAPPATAPKITAPKTATLPTTPAVPAASVAAPANTAAVAATAPETNRTTSSAANTTSKPSTKTNSTPAPITTATAPTQKTTTSSSTSKKTNRPIQTASTHYDEPVYEPIRIAPQPAAAPPARTESPVVSSGTLQRHQINKNIAAMCQNSAGAWLPCR